MGMTRELKIGPLSGRRRDTGAMFQKENDGAAVAGFGDGVPFVGGGPVSQAMAVAVVHASDDEGGSNFDPFPPQQAETGARMRGDGLIESLIELMIAQHAVFSEGGIQSGKGREIRFDTGDRGIYEVAGTEEEIRLKGDQRFRKTLAVPSGGKPSQVEVREMGDPQGGGGGGKEGERDATDSQGMGLPNAPEEGERADGAHEEKPFHRCERRKGKWKRPRREVPEFDGRAGAKGPEDEGHPQKGDREKEPAGRMIEPVQRETGVKGRHQCEQEKKNGDADQWGRGEEPLDPDEQSEMGHCVEKDGRQKKEHHAPLFYQNPNEKQSYRSGYGGVGKEKTSPERKRWVSGMGRWSR